MLGSREKQLSGCVSIPKGIRSETDWETDLANKACFTPGIGSLVGVDEDPPRQTDFCVNAFTQLTQRYDELR